MKTLIAFLVVISFFLNHNYLMCRTKPIVTELPGGAVLYEWGSKERAGWVFAYEKHFDELDITQHHWGCTNTSGNQCAKDDWYVEIDMLFSEPSNISQCWDELTTAINQNMPELLDMNYIYGEVKKNNERNGGDPIPDTPLESNMEIELHPVF